MKLAFDIVLAVLLIAYITSAVLAAVEARKGK